MVAEGEGGGRVCDCARQGEECVRGYSEGKCVLMENKYYGTAKA